MDAQEVLIAQRRRVLIDHSQLPYMVLVVSYSLNGKCEVSFNPADHAFAERFYSAIDEMGKLQDEYAKKGEALQDPGEAFSLAQERDVEMGKTLSVEGVGYNAGIKDKFFHSESTVPFFVIDRKLYLCCGNSGTYEAPNWGRLGKRVEDSSAENAKSFPKFRCPRLYPVPQAVQKLVRL